MGRHLPAAAQLAPAAGPPAGLQRIIHPDSEWQSPKFTLYAGRKKPPAAPAEHRGRQEAGRLSREETIRRPAGKRAWVQGRSSLG